MLIVFLELLRVAGLLVGESVFMKLLPGGDGNRVVSNTGQFIELVQLVESLGGNDRLDDALCIFLRLLGLEGGGTVEDVLESFLGDFELDVFPLHLLVLHFDHLQELLLLHPSLLLFVLQHLVDQRIHTLGEVHPEHMLLPAPLGACLIADELF